MFTAWEQQAADSRYAGFETWLDGVLANRQLPDGVVALNVNIYDGANDTYDVELIGAPAFDENDDDWACEELFTSDILSLPVTPETEDWEEGLAHIIGMVRQYLQTGRFRGMLEGFEAVGVGHVNGAIEVVYRRPAAPEQPVAAQPASTQPLDLFAEAEIEAAGETTKAAPEETPGEPVACFKLIREIRPKNINAKPQREYGIRQYELLRAVPFTRWDPGFTFVYQADKGSVATDLLSNSMGWLVVSPKLKALLEELEEQIEFFPVKVEAEGTGAALEGYHVANLLRKQDALSLPDSDYSVMEHPVFGRYNSVKKYALRSNAVGDAVIFKLPEHQEIPVFVTEAFKQRMEAEGVTGVAYYPVKMV